MKEWIGCACWIALGLAGLIASADLQIMTRFGPGPGFFIRGLTVAMLALALIQAATLLLGRRRASHLSQPSPDNVAAVLNVDEDDAPEIVTPQSLLRFALLAASLFAYGLLVEEIGFIISTTLLAFAAMALLGRPVLRSAIEAIIAVLAAYLLFGMLLGVNLPRARLPVLAAFGL